MYRIQFRSTDGTETTFDERRVLRIGSGEDNDIVLDSAGVSRSHAELRPSDTGWDLHDVGSQGGTWVGGQRIAHVPLGATTNVLFGAEIDGVEATIAIDLPDSAAEKTPGDQQTVLLPDQQSTYIDGGGQAPTDGPANAVLIRTRDGDKRVDAASARIGRDIRSDVVVDDPVVSRQHANVERRADGWWFVDNSNSGSYIDGKPVKEKRIAEPTVVQLGHPEAGYQVTLVPVVAVAAAQKAIAGKRRRATLTRVAVGAAVVALVAAGVTATVLLTGNDQDTLSTAELDHAKRASVQIIGLGADGIPRMSGSGTLISSDGLVLTNAHVAKPTAKGQPGAATAKDAPTYQVALAKDDNTPAAPKYRATTLVADGYLDLAVMKIDANADGTPLDGGKLALPEPMAIGDSNALQTGDHITALGYPGLTTQRHSAGPLTITSGDVSAFMRDYATNTERFWIDTTARIAHGNSGGASINSAGQLVAVNTAFKRSEENEPAASYLIRPIAFAADIIKVARNGSDPNYVSPYLDKIQDLPATASATSSGWDKDDSADCGPARDPDQPNHLTGVHEGDIVHPKFQLTGIPDNAPVAVGFVDDHKNVIDITQIVWPYGTSPRCISPDLKITPGLTFVVAVLVVGYQDELKVTNGVEFG